MAHCTSGGCHQGKLPCPTPNACEVSERPRTFKPDLTVEGPFFPTTRAGWERFFFNFAVIVLLLFVAGAVGRHLGWV